METYILGPTNNPNVQITEEGINFKGRSPYEIPTANGDFINIDDYVPKLLYDKEIEALEARIAALEAKHPEAAA